MISPIGLKVALKIYSSGLMYVHTAMQNDSLWLELNHATEALFWVVEQTFSNRSSAIHAPSPRFL